MCRTLKLLRAAIVVAVALAGCSTTAVSVNRATVPPEKLERDSRVCLASPAVAIGENAPPLAQSSYVLQDERYTKWLELRVLDAPAGKPRFLHQAAASFGIEWPPEFDGYAAGVLCDAVFRGFGVEGATVYEYD